MNVLSQTKEAEQSPQSASYNVCVPKERPDRFDIFKGQLDENGKVIRIKSVGCAFLHPGSCNYTVFLRTFVNDVFYLLKETRDPARGDYGILTRIHSRNPKRKFIWNNVGEARFLVGPNKGLLHLSWDLLGARDIYMSMTPETNPRN